MWTTRYGNGNGNGNASSESSDALAVQALTYKDNCNSIFRINNEIHFCDDVTYASMHKLIMMLKEAESDALDHLEKATTALIMTAETKKHVDLVLTPKPIKLFITTHGGAVYAALKAVDIIRSLKVPVHTIVAGYVASAGTLLSIVGAKRFITPHSFMLVHELRSGFWGKYTDAREQIENMDKLMELLISLMKENTKIPETELNQILSRDRNWGATECIEKGLVDALF